MQGSQRTPASGSFGGRGPDPGSARGRVCHKLEHQAIGGVRGQGALQQAAPGPKGQGRGKKRGRQRRRPKSREGSTNRD